MASNKGLHIGMPHYICMWVYLFINVYFVKSHDKEFLKLTFA